MRLIEYVSPTVPFAVIVVISLRSVDNVCRVNYLIREVSTIRLIWFHFIFLRLAIL